MGLVVQKAKSKSSVPNITYSMYRVVKMLNYNKKTQTCVTINALLHLTRVVMFETFQNPFLIVQELEVEVNSGVVTKELGMSCLRVNR
jgi:hypothetical protein